MTIIGRTCLPSTVCVDHVLGDATLKANCWTICSNPANTPVTLTLPNSPPNLTYVRISDTARNAGSYAIIINPDGGDTIASAGSWAITEDGGSIELLYYASQNIWLIIG